MAKRVTTIPATLNRFTAAPLNRPHRKKVAGYARVSTELEEQQSSYEAQLDYYSTYIKGHEEWEFVGMYSDEGITGTSTAKREGFNQMVEDALAGKIDLIITKSVSRFARNTVDSLTTVRELKDRGVEIYFEKENIWTLDAKGELLITIMSSLAQEESRSISENTTWGKRKAFSDGKCSVGFGTFLGYDKGPNGEFIVNEEQAKTVRLIYKLFIRGNSPRRIARILEEKGIPSPAGKKVWYQSAIYSILTNEKYKGDALLQKTYTKDFLTKKAVRNHGEIQQYYVHDHHEAIIDKVTFNEVQHIMKQRKGIVLNQLFCGKVKCGICGSWYGSASWHGPRPEKEIVYRCQKKYKDGQRCNDSPTIPEVRLKEVVVNAVNTIITERDELIANVQLMMEKCTDTSALADRRQALMDELSGMAERAQMMVSENASSPQDQEEYQRKYDALIANYDAKNAEYNRLGEEISEKESNGEYFRRLIEFIEDKEELITEFDDELLYTLVDYITVYSKKDIRVTFKSGIEV
ncbi:MAG: recombinase family protein [Lachnospiraceae bacterium]|nr:recombinase family protein [Lachnospiraceae bacterium]